MDDLTLLAMLVALSALWNAWGEIRYSARLVSEWKRVAINADAQADELLAELMKARRSTEARGKERT